MFLNAVIIAHTPNPEQHCVFTARGLGDSNGEKRSKNYDQYEKLLTTCLNDGHWSVFEHSVITVEISAPRYITRQMLRHRSFAFQELSQRYWQVSKFHFSLPRLQNTKNRQSSIETYNPFHISFWLMAQAISYFVSYQLYQIALKMGIAKEVARSLLPEAIYSHLAMTGNLRSWITYLRTRRDIHTQEEHRYIAHLIAKELAKLCPTIAKIEKW